MLFWWQNPTASKTNTLLKRSNTWSLINLMTAYGTDSLSKSFLLCTAMMTSLTPLEKFKLNDDCGGYKKHCQHRRLQLLNAVLLNCYH